MVPMLVESAKKNLEDLGDNLRSDAIDWLDLTWLEYRTRFARKSTRSGREVRLLLRPQQTLKHGDVLDIGPMETRWSAYSIDALA
jgi:urease accessory protein UreE